MLSHTCYVMLCTSTYVYVYIYIYMYRVTIYTYTYKSQVCLSFCLCSPFLTSLPCRAWSGLCRSPPQRLLMAQDSSWAQHHQYIGDLHQNTWEICGNDFCGSFPLMMGSLFISIYLHNQWETHVGIMVSCYMNMSRHVPQKSVIYQVLVTSQAVSILLQCVPAGNST